jgi:glycosyltransferase involved in cell wall biosynthesis
MHIKQPHLLCTVIIPTYNRSSLLSLTLESLITQTLCKSSFEVLVIDDGSSDNTRQVAESFSTRLNMRYAFKPREGYRLAAARNIGFKEAHSEICIVVDDGMLLHTRFLEAHVANHTNDPEPRAVIGYAYCFGIFDEKAFEGQFDEQELRDINGAIDLSDIDSTIERFKRVERWLDIRDRFVYDKLGDELEEYPAPWALFFGCNFSAPTAQLRLIGGCDEFFRTFGGCDIDLGYRLYRSGVKLVLDRDAAAIHAPHEPNLLTLRKSLLCSSYYVATKYRTPITALLPHVSVLDLNQYILRRRIERCENFLQKVGRPSLMGIRADYLDPEHSLLRTAIATKHADLPSVSDALTLLDPEVWAELAHQFSPNRLAAH